MTIALVSIAILGIIVLAFMYAIAQEKVNDLTHQKATLEGIVKEYTELQIILNDKLKEKNAYIKELEQHVIENTPIDDLVDILNRLHSNEEGNGSGSGSMPN